MLQFLAQGRLLACQGAFKPLRSCTQPLIMESRSIRQQRQTNNRFRTAYCFASAATSNSTSTYKTPPQEILDIVDAPPEPTYSFSPSRKLVLQLSRPPANPPIAEFARPELKLAGIRIDPEGFCRSRMSYYTGMAFAPFTEELTLPFEGDAAKLITGIPEGHGINDVSWSLNSEHVAFTIRRAGDDPEAARPPAQLWIADLVTGNAHCLLDRSINSIFEDYTWLDSDTIIASVIPDCHSEAPTKPAVALGPKIEDNSGGQKSQSRTYQDLLKDNHDVALFEHYCSSQLVLVKISTGEVTPLSNENRIYTAIAPSPDGQYIVAAWLEPPWSFAVPCGRFPKRVELWDNKGNFIREIAQLPLALDIPLAFDSCRKGPRSMQWRDDKPSELVWVECQDGGDPAVEISPRDVVYSLGAADAVGQKDDATPRVIAATDMRYGGITWGHGDLAILYESEWKTRKSRSWIFSPDNPEKSPELLFDRNYEDSYTDPGSPMMRRTELGQYVLMEVNGPRKLLLQGSGASPQGSRPFLDLLDLDTRETKRLWQSSPPYYEFLSSVISDVDEKPVPLENLKMLGRRESMEEPPQYYIVNFNADSATTDWRKISEFPHPYPTLKGLTKQVLRYKRSSDGVELNGSFFLPPGYDQDRDGKLPCIVWAYPREFKSKDAAGQLRKSPHQFDNIGSTSPLLFLTKGYAVLDGPSMPIVGEGEEEPNDTYVEQLTSSARAAVEELERQGTVDITRLSISGHSYGAFMSAGILAHAPDLFACGIARSGAYNRTFTPFGFQSEERTLWEAPETYTKMSPFNNADKIKKPLLLIHGEADNNPGTLTLQSERLYAAIKGHGCVSRLVILPLESHSYTARESILHTLAETYDWLEKYC